jgi:predicted MFS family arabinose efflux permease
VIASGLLTDGPGWRWVFFINVPIGVILFALAATLLARDEPRERQRRFDVVGATTVTAGLLVLVYALNRAADYGWTSASTLSLFAGAAVLLALFVGVEARTAEPLIPARVVKSRALVVANSMAFFAFGGFFSFIFLGSLLMQQVLGYSATRTGVSWLATSATAFVVAGITGARLIETFGARRLLMTAMASLALSALWLTRVPSDASYATDLLPAFVLAGLAIGLASVSVQISALTGVSGSAAGLASGLVETMREIGGAVGVAAVSTVLISGAGNIGGPVAPARVEAVLDTFQKAFIVVGVFAVLGGVLATIGFSRVPKRAEVGGDEYLEAQLHAGTLDLIVDLAASDGTSALPPRAGAGHRGPL